MIAILASIAFACAAMLGIAAGSALCAKRQPFDDGPVSADPPILGLTFASAAFGAGVGLHAAGLYEIVVLTMLCGIFAAIWYSDVRVGLIPDAFTLVPLAVVCAYAAFRGEWGSLISAAVAFCAFAGAAAASRGLGMGWGDAKLAALGGAVLGIETAALAFAAATFVLALRAIVRRNRAKPTAFGPYLISAMALALWLPLLT